MNTGNLVLFSIILPIALFYNSSHNLIKYDSPRNLIKPNLISAYNVPRPPRTILDIIDISFEREGAGVSAIAKRIAWCESRYHPERVNPTSYATGLFQILPSTWRRNCSDLSNPKSVTDSATCAERIYDTDSRNGYGFREWECK